MQCNYEHAGKWISILYRQFQVFVNRELKTYEINSSQFVFLNSLFHADGVNQEELSAKLLIDKSATARAIKKLEENGYIKREINEEDKRAYKVYLTPRALEIKDEIRKCKKKWNEVLMTGIDDEDGQKLIGLLKHMSSNVLESLSNNDLTKYNQNND